MNRYSEAMAEKRRRLGYSQADFADYLHYSVQTIAKYERGLSEMDVSSLIYTARFLQVDVDSFLKGEDAKRNEMAETHGFDPDLFTKNLVTARIARRMNQNKLAKLSGCSARSIKNYEGGKSLPSLSVFDAMLQVLNVSASDFLFEDLSLRPEFVVTAKNKKAWVAGITLASFGLFRRTSRASTACPASPRSSPMTRPRSMTPPPRPSAPPPPRASTPSRSKARASWPRARSRPFLSLGGKWRPVP